MMFTVAIDGPAAAGKGTISKAVAAHYDFTYLDTGLLYRAVAAKVLEGADPLVAAKTLHPSDLDNANLRTHHVADAASKVAVNADVRATLLTFQRDFACRNGGAVLDGRDIGTMVLPDASAKLYVTASAQCRAIRRQKELQDLGDSMSTAQVLADVIARDIRDAERTTAPMIAAQDAIIIDTSDMTIAQAVAAAVAYIDEKRT